jgi:hypothetical protein
MKKGKLNIKRIVKSFAAVILLGVILTSTADATLLGTTNIENHNNGLSDIGQLWGGGDSGGFYYTGIYSWTNNIVGSTGLGTKVPDFGFCIELTQGAYNGAVDVIPLEEAPLPVSILYGTPMGTSKADYIRELWSRFFDPSWLTGGTANKKMGEAFGAAIWEIIYETDPVWNVNTGKGFHAAYIDQAATANRWLGQLTGNGPLANDLFAISNAKGQDYIVQIPDWHVPEPATICLLGLGALSLIRRRKA